MGIELKGKTRKRMYKTKKKETLLGGSEARVRQEREERSLHENSR